MSKLMLRPQHVQTYAQELDSLRTHLGQEILADLVAGIVTQQHYVCAAAELRRLVACDAGAAGPAN